TSLAIHEGGRLVVSGSVDRTARVWDLARGVAVARYDAAAEVHAVAARGGEVLAGTSAGTVERFPGGRSYAGPEGTVRAVLFTADGFVAVASRGPAVWRFAGGPAARRGAGPVRAAALRPGSPAVLCLDGALQTLSLEDSR
ncbi:MAG: hypothetical protein ACRC33_32075, partial [Gemmataceae bacterium]